MAKAVAARQTARSRRADPQRRAAARPAQRGAIPARAGIDRLQRALGNRGMYHLLRSGAIQAKLTIGPADDEYEREADRVADDVMRMPETPSGLTAQGTEEELQRASVTQAPSGGGAEGMCPPLPDPDGDWAKEKWLCEMRLEAWGSNARLLAPGAKGRSVELLHQVMHHWLCWISPTKIPEHTLPAPESNLYTEATGLVVKDFQKFSHAVMQDGIVGPETISLLDGYVGGPDIPPADCGIPEPKPEPDPEPEPDDTMCIPKPGIENSECDAYAKENWWLPEAYVHNATCACQETPNVATANCVRSFLQDRLGQVDREVKVEASHWLGALLTRRVSKSEYINFVQLNLTPIIFKDHVDAYRDCCCPSGPAPLVAWRGVTTFALPCAAVGAAIREFGSCHGTPGEW